MHPKPPSGRPAPARPNAPAAKPQPGAPSPADAYRLVDEDAQFERLQELLEQWPAALDASALDGFLCGVLLQPQTVPLTDWLARVTDPEAQGVPATTADPAALRELHHWVRSRHEQLRQAIAARQWFDPWLTQAQDEGESVRDSVLPWVAGFALAADLYPALTDRRDPALNEPLALLYLHWDPEDLEDADALLAQIEEIEPPADLSEAADDLVRAVMLLADVSHSLVARRKPGRR